MGGSLGEFGFWTIFNVPGGNSDKNKTSAVLSSNRTRSEQIERHRHGEDATAGVLDNFLIGGIRCMLGFLGHFLAAFNITSLFYSNTRLGIDMELAPELLGYY
ncbi:hypothetical protein OIU76_030354 [Salix suchowensis]|nr:hypothetical protein OIU76_030354 [Salix suchowensis]